MPVYIYEILGQGENAGQTFEKLQKIGDAPLEFHPETGEPVRRVVAAPSLVFKSGDAAKGFTRYEKAGDGVYEKTSGKGPKTIKR